MKRLAALVLFAALLAFCCTAWADQWGMSGEMSEFLKRSGDYDDVRYPQLSSGYSREAEFMHFIVRKGSENLLVVLRRGDDGRLEEVGRYPGAVRPLPGGRTTEFWNGATENGIRLKSMWSELGEEYYFIWDGQEMVLDHANTGKVIITMRADGAGYAVNDGTDDERWLNRPLTLAEFRMDMLPQSSGEVLLWDMQLTYYEEMLDYSRRVRANLGRNSTLPVYAAPCETAWRGADGKASVSLREPFDVLAACGDGWYMVEYELSRAERRIGFVHGLEAEGVQPMHMTAAVETMALSVHMTDDPHGTRRSMAFLPAGTKVEALGLLDAEWLCIRTQVDGREAWGFVPLCSVAVTEMYHDKAAMQQLRGVWHLREGSSAAGDSLTFGADGSLLVCRQEMDADPLNQLTMRNQATAWCAADPWEAQGPWLMVWTDDGRIDAWKITFSSDRPGNESLRLQWGAENAVFTRGNNP